MSDPHAARIVVVEPEAQTPEQDLFPRVAGALLGGAIVDALGWPTEFARTPKDLERVGVLEYPLRDFVPWHKRTGGRFFTRVDNIQPGDYSDDTQLTLAVARSLNADGSTDPDYFAKQELKYWLGYARGAGATVTAAAKAASRVKADWRWNFFSSTRGRRAFDYRDAGANGAAMRISPIALANLNDPHRMVIEIWRNSIVTHGHPRAIIGALVYGEALRTLASGQDLVAERYVRHLRSFIRDLDAAPADEDLAHWRRRWSENHVPFEAQWPEFVAEMDSMLGVALEGQRADLRATLTRLGAFEPATKGSGTASVAAAIALFLRRGKDFRNLALEAANMLGSDTDTIGAMAGSLAGAWGGYMEIPERWATLMADYTYLNRMAAQITLVALRKTTSQAHRLSPLKKGEPAPGTGSLMTALDRQDVLKGHRYWHPLFGLGWATSVESQEVGRPRVKGRVIMATIQFDFGQTCKFTSYSSLPAHKPQGQQPKKARRSKAPQLDLSL